MSQNQELIKTKNVSFNESNNKKNKTPSHKKTDSKGNRKSIVREEDRYEPKKIVVEDNSKLSREANMLVKMKLKSSKQLNYFTNDLQNPENAKDSNKDLKLVTYSKNEPIPLKSNLAIELEDPANEPLRPEIQKIIHITNDVNSLTIDYCNLVISKEDIETEINDLKKSDKNKQRNIVEQIPCKSN